MKKVSQKQKKWNDHKAKKQIRILERNNKRYGKGRKIKKYSDGEKTNSRHSYKLIAPNQLTILNDQEEKTLSYFDEAIDTIQKCKIGASIYFDLLGVKDISADAVMYIIALVNNYKRVNILKIQVSGNLPEDPNAKSFIEDVGFYSYVRGLKEQHNKSKDRFRISQGDKPNSAIVGKLCDFTAAGGIINTKRLYSMIIELMTNTCQHAYRREQTAKMKSNWYLFAEREEKTVHFVFLDTGMGIPSTIRQSFIERGIINLTGKKDASFIASALRGENRTETRQSHRGKEEVHLGDRMKCTLRRFDAFYISILRD